MLISNRPTLHALHTDRASCWLLHSSSVSDDALQIGSIEPKIKRHVYMHRIKIQTKKSQSSERSISHKNLRSKDGKESRLLTCSQCSVTFWGRMIISLNPNNCCMDSLNYQLGPQTQVQEPHNILAFCVSGGLSTLSVHYPGNPLLVPSRGFALGFSRGLEPQTAFRFHSSQCPSCPLAGEPRNLRI